MMQFGGSSQHDARWELTARQHQHRQRRRHLRERLRRARQLGVARLAVPGLAPLVLVPAVELALLHPVLRPVPALALLPLVVQPPLAPALAPTAAVG